MTARETQGTLEEARSFLAGDPDKAARLARRIIVGDSGNSRAFRLLAAAARRLGRHEEAAHAEADAIQASARSPQLVDAAKAMRGREIEKAERLLRSWLGDDPDDPQALRMLAEIAAVCGHGGDAERLLRKALEAAPGFVPLYINLAALLQDLSRPGEAIALLDEVLANAPGNELVLSFKADILAAAGLMDKALKTHEDVIARAPDAAVVHINHGHALKAVGRGEEAAAAYRRSIELDPASGFAWWALANLKTATLDSHDIAAMEKALAGDVDDLNRIQLRFALGKALGDEERYEDSFHQYAAANDLRRALIPCDLNEIEEAVRKARALFTREFLNERAGQGCGAPDPIFIVGLPRSGSTLVEQILASHPSIEGAGELHAMESIAAATGRQVGVSWLDAIGTLNADALRMLGENYLAAARSARRAERPFFTDKMPYNWLYAGLILCALPNATIVDVRRHPMACCFSNFAMYFNRSTNFASGLEEIGRYYCAYIRMMDHFDSVAPGRIHRVFYEGLVHNSEGATHKLLSQLGLPFDDACLRFYDNPRAVHTPSALQVRQPIYKEDVERWQNYEPWLGPLKKALGAVLDVYPAAPSVRRG